MLGAGASADLRFPLGTELMGRITAHTTSNRGHNIRTTRLVEILLKGLSERLYPAELGLHFDKIRDLAPTRNSIDDFLYSYSEDLGLQFTAKAFIALSILDAENRSLAQSIVQHGRFSETEVNATFYYKLCKQIVSRWKATEYEKCLDAAHNNLSIITFNYDRALEWMLTWYCSKYFQISHSEAVRCIRKFEIIHVYGSCGSIDPESDQFHAFGSSDSALRIYQNSSGQALPVLADMIRTYDEKGEEKIEKLCRKRTSEAESIYMVGCYPHPQNVDLLFGEHGNDRGRFYGTGFGLSRQEISDFEAYLVQRGFDPEEIVIEKDWKGPDLIDQTKVGMALRGRR